MTTSNLADAERVLRAAKTIAILGAHQSTARPAHYVPAYLAEQGYTVIPVNPRMVGKTLFGRPALASLTAIDVAVDIVDVFRRGDFLAAHLDEILSMSPRPKVVWLQLGVSDADFVAQLRGEGIEVIENRCTLADHRALRIQPIVDATADADGTTD